ncbi:MAG: 2-C-methyl-D-erythritol 2,4-cyclodiphosphate synthase [Solirubrobacteraceae bacterium MAG38_C4-C5]|nr:2-C-methyl-D-erythritol 2,4-cyclodiphosphate synthase [Candidatus Siliceabacter maunaloa]
MSFATGIGWDSHRLVEGRPLILGGVRIEHDRGPAGHSDADVLCHAVIDALLGAACLGDIGEQFPDDDPRWKDADSLTLLSSVCSRLAAEGWTVNNVDASVLLERPKLSPHREAMRAGLAGAIAIPPERVNVKATTGEGMGFVGREEGVGALAVATIMRG